jgi:glycosyltransferase involved in cell wall biosynthesis
MKILFCNKYFFLNGGVEKYLYDVMNYLSNRGHETIPFSVRYAGSWPTPYADYFLPPPGDPGQALWANIRFSPANILRFLDRSTYSFEARVKLNRLIKAIGGADIAYILNIYNYMSPSIIHTLRAHRIPVAMQIGDYNLLCPSYSFLRNSRPCTLCARGDYYHGLCHRCVKNNIIASSVRVSAMYLQRLIRIYELIDAFVVPCDFMRTKLIEGGFSKARLHLLPYPVELRQRKRRKEGDRDGEGRRRGEKPSSRIHILQYPIEHQAPPDPGWRKKNYIVYFGRLSYEKGLDTLIRAFQKLNPPVELYIIGRSYDGEEDRLRSLIEPHVKDRIHFIGFQSGPTLMQWITEALFSVVPSRWYDNAPISTYESFLNGTAVLASRIGGIPEQVEDGVSGCLFEPDSSEDLASKMDLMLSDRERLVRMGLAGKAFVREKLNIKDQMDGLVSLFEAVIADYRRR